MTFHKYLGDSKMFEFDKHYRECQQQNKPFIKAKINPVHQNYFVQIDLMTCNYNFSENDQKQVQKMIDDEIIRVERKTVVCQSSKWIYTDVGGLLTIQVELRQIVNKGDKIAEIRNIFGSKIKEFYAPEDGIVIGKSVSPVNQTGGRILHLGIIK